MLFEYDNKFLAISRIDPTSLFFKAAPDLQASEGLLFAAMSACRAERNKSRRTLQGREESREQAEYSRTETLKCHACMHN
jgi:hypothetical protein